MFSGSPTEILSACLLNIFIAHLSRGSQEQYFSYRHSIYGIFPENRTYVLGERDPGSPRIGERQASEMIEAGSSFQTFTSASSTQYINKYNTVEH